MTTYIGITPCRNKTNCVYLPRMCRQTSPLNWLVQMALSALFPRTFYFNSHKDLWVYGGFWTLQCFVSNVVRATCHWFICSGHACYLRLTQTTRCSQGMPEKRGLVFCDRDSVAHVYWLLTAAFRRISRYAFDWPAYVVVGIRILRTRLRWNVKSFWRINSLSFIAVRCYPKRDQAIFTM